MSFYEDVVASGGGLMLGRFMLAGWKNTHPEQHCVQDHIDLYEHIDDPVWLSKTEAFERWYENPLDQSRALPNDFGHFIVVTSCTHKS